MGRFFPGAALIWLLVLLLAGCRESPPPALDHDAYVWQRRWSKPVETALRDSADLIRAWHILAGEVDARGRFQRIAVDLAAVAASGRPAIPVVRIEAPLAKLDRPGLIAEIAALQHHWQASRVSQTGLEIDYDCATRQLADYAAWLVTLRQSMASHHALSITLLPDWLSAPELDALLASVDQTVLQLHAVDNPAGVLFDPASARGWTAALARRTEKPFWVALPDYGSLVRRDENGRIAAIESETSSARPAPDGDELFAAPASVAGFLRQLEARPLPALRGIVWFRLPLASDQRAWTPGTWRAVITHRNLPVRLVGEIRRSATAATQSLLVRNTGEIDTVLPAALIVAAPCRGNKGGESFSLEQQGSDSVFLRTRKSLLRAGGELVVGTLNCPSGASNIEIEP